ncbi:hypothetical protein HDF24_18445 [Mucilaginibacter sp. X4EP1]|uniref:hypothetical protein n=1 Tax=Mucilaginibacter sp. X4EP1 TaxID=2723092 RepID=UPI00216AA02B|nr:hypothetical protein [Mucilaginibacter sp. X4EP1]MCS3813450.1 hypothetical protein [Mucilaginibacter sp. X4EP1]
MKYFYPTFLFIFFIQFANAQSQPVHGYIQDETTKFLHYVVITDDEYGVVALSDSSGNFEIKVHPDSKLKFELSGYRDTIIAADKFTDGLQLVMKTLSTFPIEKEFIRLHPALSPNGSMEMPKPRVPTEGSKYLSDVFMHGFFRTKQGTNFYSADYLYNYNKITGSFILCTSEKSVYEFYADQLESITLINSGDEQMTFEKVPVIDRYHFVQVLANGTKYNIYKLIKTSFVASDVTHTAMGQVGDDLDKYTDDVQYFAFNVLTKQLQNSQPGKARFGQLSLVTL